MRRIAAIVAMALALVSCGPGGSEGDEDGSVPRDNPTLLELDWNDQVSLITVAGVDCIIAQGSESIGLDCNWEGYNHG